jgi:hypothetical protein
MGKESTSKIIGLFDEKLDGLSVAEKLERIYQKVGEYIKANAKELASDAKPEQAVPIVLAVKVDYMTATIEKQSKFYVMEEEV